MNQNIEQQILDALKILYIPGEKINIVDMKRLSNICIVQNTAYLSITVPHNLAQQLQSLRLNAQQIVQNIPQIKNAVVTLTENKNKPILDPIIENKLKINALIAIASGKGGVGKSTTAVNLACALKNKNKNVAILDADIYGPSIPKLLQLSGKAEILEKKILKPMENYGIKIMSMASLVDDNVAMIWRGPMVQSAIMHMFQNVSWGQLDFLLIDMPPGTGDAHLTVAQKIPLSGVVIVSTPQDLALIDVKRAINMYQKMKVPIIGIIENMSYFVTSDTGKRYDLFGNGGVRAEAEKMGIPFLESIPFDMDVRILSDLGIPIIIDNPNSVVSKMYQKISDRIQEYLLSKT
ncbi:iron-sulfur cluster carrier protein ApbC [Candidatus Liberibacter solanacearum]|uniref:Iron-sulfur cluster carrier protein n=3 Tax=Candidatus Liberibacter solanacearum TaxID=556287 RepID=A0A3R7RJ95_9HYPH|nr:Mrp/NBP35 family ATP-binding protein [Candidatus Liberibacter solanacearum]RPD37138.1 iron-sulfur cluster carrier protein ApbC [Candidatus Liberibacter solanacearum]